MKEQIKIDVLEVDRPLTDGEDFNRDIVKRFAKENYLVIGFIDASGTTACRIDVVLLKPTVDLREEIRALFYGFASTEEEKEGYVEFEIQGIEKNAFYEMLAIKFTPWVRMFSIEKPEE